MTKLWCNSHPAIHSCENIMWTPLTNWRYQMYSVRIKEYEYYPDNDHYLLLFLICYPSIKIISIPWDRQYFSRDGRLHYIYIYYRASIFDNIIYIYYTDYSIHNIINCPAWLTEVKHRSKPSIILCFFNFVF